VPILFAVDLCSCVHVVQGEIIYRFGWVCAYGQRSELQAARLAASGVSSRFTSMLQPVCNTCGLIHVF
jgi:hypothetical protein